MTVRIPLCQANKTIYISCFFCHKNSEHSFVHTESNVEQNCLEFRGFDSFKFREVVGGRPHQLPAIRQFS